MDTTIKVNLTKMDCGWCPPGTPAPWAVTDRGWTDYACTLHVRKYWADLLVGEDCLWCNGLISEGEERVSVHITDAEYRDAHASCNDAVTARARAIVRGAH